jgi:hypothetical protein
MATESKTDIEDTKGQKNNAYRYDSEELSIPKIIRLIYSIQKDHFMNYTNDL